MTRINLVTPLVATANVVSADPGTTGLYLRYRGVEGSGALLDQGSLGINAAIAYSPNPTYTGDGILYAQNAGCHNIGSGAPLLPLFNGPATWCAWVKPANRTDKGAAPWITGFEFPPNAFAIAHDPSGGAPSDDVVIRGVGANVWTNSGGGDELEWGSGLPIQSGLVSAGVWTHIAAVYDTVAGESRLYVDGVLIDTQASVPVSGSIEQARVGCCMRAGSASQISRSNASATVADCRAYARVLSLKELQWLAASGRNP